MLRCSANGGGRGGGGGRSGGGGGRGGGGSKPSSGRDSSSRSGGGRGGGFSDGRKQQQGGRGSPGRGRGTGGRGGGGGGGRSSAGGSSSGGGSKKQQQKQGEGAACLVAPLRTSVQSELAASERMPEPLWGTFCGVSNGLWCGITAAYSPFSGWWELGGEGVVVMGGRGSSRRCLCRLHQPSQQASA